MNFIHGVDLENWHLCWNLSLNGQLISPNYLAVIDSGIAAVQKPIEVFSIDELKLGDCQVGVITPRSALVLVKAAVLRSGQKMANGYGEVINISGDERSRILKMSDVELRFEEVRRNQYPDKVSRLSCLWVAERTNDGLAHLKQMFGPKIYIADVRIAAALKLTRADTYWFDEYWTHGQEEAIQRYWQGDASLGNPTWEYLLDGALALEDQSQLDYIKANGQKVPC